MATQLKGVVLPIKQTFPRLRARAVTEDEKKYSVFGAMRMARADAKLVGIRVKKAKQKADANKMKK